ncbi:Uncharacterized protein HZ326_17565, partial [Fusarium oxysporum f. sp. albedinis]
NSSQVISTK